MSLRQVGCRRAGGVVGRSGSRLKWLAAAVAVGVAGPRAVAQSVYNWTGPNGTANAPTTGSWNNAASGTLVWDTDGDGVPDAATITSSADNVLSFGGTGTTNLLYTSNANLNGDFQLNQLINNNSAKNGSSATQQTVGVSGGTNVRLVFVANALGTGPTVSVSGAANLGISPAVLVNTPLTINGTTTSGLVQFNGVISGTSTITLAGSTDQTRADFINGNNTFGGGLTFTRGNLIVGSDSTVSGGVVTKGPLGTGTFTINNTLGATSAILRASTNSNRNVANAVTLAGNVVLGQNIGTSGGSLTLSGPVTITGGTRTIDTRGQFTPTGGTITVSEQFISGAIGEDGTSRGLTKAGVGTLVFSGTNANTYTGPTTVSAGTLALAKSAGTIAVGGNVIVGDNSTSGNAPAGALDELQLRASNQIADGAAVTLNGGLLNLNGNSEGTSGTVGVGTLTSQNASKIDFGTTGSSRVLHFADSSATSASWSGTLSILDWAGDFANGGGADQLLFGSSAGGLTPAELARISFVNPAGTAAGTYSAVILSSGEVVPSVPEPAGVGLVAAGALAMLRRRRRRAA